MPKFQPNPSPFMKGYAYPGTAPTRKEKKEKKKEVSRTKIKNVSLENRKAGFSAFEVTYDDGSKAKVLTK